MALSVKDGEGYGVFLLKKVKCEYMMGRTHDNVFAIYINCILKNKKHACYCFRYVHRTF